MIEVISREGSNLKLSSREKSRKLTGSNKIIRVSSNSSNKENNSKELSNKGSSNNKEANSSSSKEGSSKIPFLRECQI